MRNNIWAVLGLLGFLALITTGIILYASGFRLDLSQRTLAKTGMILVKSLPDGARVFLDEKLVGATDSTIGSLEPKTYHLKIEKEGYIPWERDVEVKAELVTNITAILPPMSPSLTAITQGGAQQVTAAPSGSKAAFLSGSKLFLLLLNNPFLGFLRTRSQEIAQEPADFPFSKVTRIEFSPNEDQLLLTAAGKAVLFKVQTGAAATKVENPDALRAQWQNLIREQRTEAVKTLKIPDEFKDLALAPASVWSPDERKFLYEKSADGKRQIWVANFTDPMPVGEEINRLVLETTDSNLKLFWLSSSQHFVVLEGDTISILDLDGTNKREIFSGKLAEPIALSSTDLAQVIVATSISTNSPANLYGISLR
ncbi:MAG: PEGA domain-containing protein [candidate division WWE3 bacterium]|nr:PEGA domain-containing protein [candidate division WWE3 bacterium]